MSDNVRVVCPYCNRTNRLPRTRLGEHPRCGACKQPLFSAEPIELSDANFAAVIGNHDIPVVVDCWASWCGPCRTFAPVFRQATAELEPGYRFAKLDTEANQATAARLNIRSIPTILVFSGGHEIARSAGAMPLPQFSAWLRQAARA